MFLLLSRQRLHLPGVQCLFPLSPPSFQLSVVLGFFLFSPPFHCNTPSFSSSHWVSSLCCQWISFGGSFVSVTLFSHCGLCLCWPISLSLSACVHGLLFFCLLLSSIVTLDCFFLQAGIPFICSLFLYSSPAYFILLRIPCCLPPISLFSYRLCSV